MFESLITYSKAYLIYITQCSLIFGNLPVREDWFTADGYLPMYSDDFFHTTPEFSFENSSFAKIFDYDMFRLGKAMVENNQNSNAFEYGVVVLTEMGKERKNSLENRSMKKDDDKASNIRVFKDVRIFSNTIRQAVDMMKKSGIHAQTTKVENEEYIEYTIKIPKNLKNAV